MSRTHRDKLSTNQDWIGKVPLVWIEHRPKTERKIPKEYRSAIAVGPGGMSCVCCFPPPGKRKEVFRSAKRKAENRWKREELTFRD